MLTGECYELGRGTKVDPAQAREFFERAANQSFFQAHYKLGLCYERGFGIEKDLKKAIYYYNQATNQNVGEAQLKLGTVYPFPHLHAEQCADACLCGCFRLSGECYENGVGCEKDPKKAFECYRLAAEENLIPEGQYRLGTTVLPPELPSALVAACSCLCPFVVQPNAIWMAKAPVATRPKPGCTSKSLPTWASKMPGRCSVRGSRLSKRSACLTLTLL